MLCRLAANFSGNTWVIQLLMSGCLIAAICKGLWEKEKGLLTYESAIKKIVFMGMVMRIGYMLYTGCTIRSHDLGDLDINGYGHAAYILKLMEQGHLPETNQIQFYQQPFYYFISAAVSRGVNAVLGTKDAYYLVDTAKIVSCIASCSSIWIAESIFKTCGLKEKGMIRAMAFVAFQPAFFSVWRTCKSGHAGSNVYDAGTFIYIILDERQKLEEYDHAGCYLRFWNDDKNIMCNYGSSYLYCIFESFY